MNKKAKTKAKPKKKVEKKVDVFPSVEFKRYRRNAILTGKCDKCDTTKGPMRLKTKNDKPELAYEIKNNAILCKKCYKK